MRGKGQPARSSTSDGGVAWQQIDDDPSLLDFTDLRRPLEKLFRVLSNRPTIVKGS